MKETDNKKMAVMFMRLPQMLHDALKEESYERRMSMNKLMLLIVADFLRKQEEYDNQ